VKIWRKEEKKAFTSEYYHYWQLESV